MFLVRRFACVCLAAMSFGFGMAAVVDKASRPARSREIGQVATCRTGTLIICPRPYRR
jgi:hypothetical protein